MAEIVVAMQGEMVAEITEDTHQKRRCELDRRWHILYLTSSSDRTSAKLRVENLHYDLTEDDLEVITHTQS